MQPILDIDWNPLITASAALLVAATPVLVAYLTIQVNAIKSQQEAAHKEARQERATLSEQIAQSRQLLEQSAVTTPNTVRNRRESDK